MKSIIWALPFILCGCMTTLPNLPIGQWSDVIVSDNGQGYPLPQNIDPAQTSFTMQEALARAIATSPEYRSSEYSLTLAQIESRQADSEIWPRLSLEGLYEIPLDNTNADSGVEGGIRINYDLTRALFRRDLQKSAAIKRQRALIQAQVILNKLSRSVFKQVAEWQVLKQEIQVIDKVLEALYREQKTLNSIAGIKGLQVAGNWRIDEEVHKYERLKRKAASRSKQLSQQLGLTLRIAENTAFEIVDADKVLSDITNQYTSQQPMQLQLSKTLQQRSDIRLAVLDIMMSVLNVRKAEIERLPRIGLSVGYGDFDLQTSNDNAGTFASLTISMPLFDFGDFDRKHETAQINEQYARDQFRALGRQAHNELSSAVEELNIAQADFEDAEQWYEKALSRLQSMDKLYQNNQIDRKDHLQAILTATATSLEMLEAKSRRYSAVIALCTVRADKLLSFHSDKEKHEKTAPKD
jgi:outer membrane protein TolC